MSLSYKTYHNETLSAKANGESVAFTHQRRG